MNAEMVRRQHGAARVDQWNTLLDWAAQLDDFELLGARGLNIPGDAGTAVATEVHRRGLLTTPAEKVVRDLTVPELESLPKPERDVVYALFERIRNGEQHEATSDLDVTAAQLVAEGRS